MRYLTLKEVLALHKAGIERWGGAAEIRDSGLLESSIAQPQMTFGGQELYPDVATKASAIGFSLVCNHPFVDGNKRVGYAAMETFMVMNGYELESPVDETEQIVLSVASGMTTREKLAEWIKAHMKRT